MLMSRLFAHCLVWMRSANSAHPEGTGGCCVCRGSKLAGQLFNKCPLRPRRPVRGPNCSPILLCCAHPACHPVHPCAGRSDPAVLYEIPYFSSTASVLPPPLFSGRSDPAFLYEILGEVIKAGATTLNIPDTTGWTLPHEFQVGGELGPYFSPSF